MKVLDSTHEPWHQSWLIEQLAGPMEGWELEGGVELGAGCGWFTGMTHAVRKKRNDNA